jgi:5-deoxy-glucuronate isomerase
MMVYSNGYQQGFNQDIDMNGNGKAMLQDAGVLMLAAGTSYSFKEADKEIVLLLQTGDIDFIYAGKQEKAVRNSFLDGEIYCLHLPRNTEVTVKANQDSEVYVLMALNDKDFSPKLYKPADIPVWENGKDVLEGTMLRYVYTIFDYQSAPYSNLVVGTVVSAPGRWSAFPPHAHEQPELYYYKFDKPQGFGLGLVGEEPVKLCNDSYALLEDNKQHPMTVAPGYAMLTVWSIAHLPGNPWDNARTVLPEHTWMMEPDAKTWKYEGK